MTELLLIYIHIFFLFCLHTAGDFAAEEEEERKRKAHEEWQRTRSKAPVPVKHPDIVVVKLVITTKVPPRYIRRFPDKTKLEILQMQINEKLKEYNLIGASSSGSGVPKNSQGKITAVPESLFCEHGRETATCKDCEAERERKAADAEAAEIARLEEVKRKAEEELLNVEKEIFDTSAFDEFENTLKQQIADAVHIPVRAVSIGMLLCPFILLFSFNPLPPIPL